MKTKISKLVSLIVSHTKVSKLYFYKCAHFFLFLSLSTVLIHHFHSYTKILALIPLIPSPNSQHSHPDFLHSHLSHPGSKHSHHSHPNSPHSFLDSLHSHHSHPDFPHSNHSHHSVPQFPTLAFTDSH